MPSAFKSNNIEALSRRLESVDRELASLVGFREKIVRRIAFLKTKEPVSAPAQS